MWPNKQGVLLLAEGKCCYPHCLHCLLSAVEALQGPAALWGELQRALPACPALMLCPLPSCPSLGLSCPSLSLAGAVPACLSLTLCPVPPRGSPAALPVPPLSIFPPSPQGPRRARAALPPPFHLRPAGGACPAPSGGFRRGLARRDDVICVRPRGAAWLWRCSASRGTAGTAPLPAPAPLPFSSYTRTLPLSRALPRPRARAGAVCPEACAGPPDRPPPARA